VTAAKETLFDCPGCGETFLRDEVGTQTCGECGVVIETVAWQAWFRQSLRDTLWLLTHRSPWHREWWRTLRGRCGYCGYCGRKDCVD
jgi:hypothetical protein